MSQLKLNSNSLKNNKSNRRISKIRRTNETRIVRNNMKKRYSMETTQLKHRQRSTKDRIKEKWREEGKSKPKEERRTRGRMIS